MTSPVITLFLCFALNLKTYALASQWSVASQDKCQFTKTNALQIYFSEKPDLFVNSLKTNDFAGCRSECCRHETCNGYVWDAMDTADNCRLLKCSSMGQDCKSALKVASHSLTEVGFITGYSDAASCEYLIIV